VSHNILRGLCRLVRLLGIVNDMKSSLLLIGVLSLACGGADLLGERAEVERPDAAAISADLSVMDALSEADIARLEQHLTASAAWSVRTDYRRLIATRNALVGDTWEGTFNGYWSDFSEVTSCPEESAVRSVGPRPLSPLCASEAVIQSRVLLALSDPESLTHGDRGQFTRAPLQGEVVLALEDYMDQPGRNSWLVLQGERLMLEVMEQAEPDARPYTQAAVDGVRDELMAVRAGAEEIDARGFLDAWTPAESWTDGDESPMALTAGERPGRYDVDLWLNPAAAGAIALRLIHLGPAEEGVEPDGLTPWDVIPSTHQLPERIGWGADASIRFAATSPIWIEQGTPGEAMRGRLEVTFTPDDGSAERVLASITRDFTGRERKSQ